MDGRAPSDASGADNDEEDDLEQEDLLPDEVPEGIPLIAADADPWEQPRVQPTARKVSAKKQYKRRARAASGKGR